MSVRLPSCWNSKYPVRCVHEELIVFFFCHQPAITLIITSTNEGGHLFTGAGLCVYSHDRQQYYRNVSTDLHGIFMDYYLGEKICFLFHLIN